MNDFVKSVDVVGVGGDAPLKSPPPISLKPKFDLPVSRPPKPEHPPPKVPKRKEW